MATSARSATSADPLVQEKSGELNLDTVTDTVMVRLVEARAPSESVTIRLTV